VGARGTVGQVGHTCVVGCIRPAHAEAELTARTRVAVARLGIGDAADRLHGAAVLVVTGFAAAWVASDVTVIGRRGVVGVWLGVARPHEPYHQHHEHRELRKTLHGLLLLARLVLCPYSLLRFFVSFLFYLLRDPIGFLIPQLLVRIIDRWQGDIPCQMS